MSTPPPPLLRFYRTPLESREALLARRDAAGGVAAGIGSVESEAVFLVELAPGVAALSPERA